MRPAVENVETVVFQYLPQNKKKEVKMSKLQEKFMQPLKNFLKSYQKNLHFLQEVQQPALEREKTPVVLSPETTGKTAETTAETTANSQIFLTNGVRTLKIQKFLCFFSSAENSEKMLKNSEKWGKKVKFGNFFSKKITSNRLFLLSDVQYLIMILKTCTNRNLYDAESLSCSKIHFTLHSRGASPDWNAVSKIL